MNILFSNRRTEGNKGLKLKIRYFAKKVIYYFFGIISYIRIVTNQTNFQRIKYKDLLYLSYFNKKLCRNYKSFFEEKNKRRITAKNKIKIGFITYTSSMWSLEKLYHRLETNEKCCVDLLVAIFDSLAEDVACEEYRKTIDYFNTNGKRCIAVDADTDLSDYDLLFYMTPYKFRDDNVNFINLSVNTLVNYVSYGFMLSDIVEKLEIPVYFLSWKYFCDSRYYKNYVKAYSRFYTDNLIYCGYPKMDIYFEKKRENKERENDRKLIIYAPHHSVMKKQRVPYSTFGINYKYMLELAKKYKNETYWIYKPHPLLEDHSIKAGIFNDVSEYKKYLHEWEELENGEVCMDGSYFNWFITSNGMITDSVSFLAEYQYVNRPLLLLERKGASYNGFGDAIKEVLYRCQGNDFAEIEKFVCNVISNYDPVRTEREQFFDENLNYFKTNKILANDYIYEFLDGELDFEK